ncbi:MAG: ABC transporter substrate-binding protein [Chloroflexi bacterium]|nr:ABC transporter substrate-binding protein [Chloroflexota bacterium]
MRFFKLMIILFALMFAIAACGGGAEEETAVPEETTEETAAEEEAEAPAEEAEAPAEEAEPEAEPEEAEEAPTGLACDEPVKVGIVTDETGPLAIYGAHILRAFPLGLEYATGAAGSEEDGYTSYMLDSCELQVYVRDDQSNPENTATVGRELIEDVGVDIVVGTVSSGATATLQELARENDVIHIAAPAAANDLTGSTFNDHSFRTSRNNYQDAVNICEYLTSQYDTFVQIAPDYSFGHGSATAFRDACTLFGGEFVADDILAPADTTDFTPYMDQVLAAADNGAEAFIVTWAGGGFVPLQQAYVDSGAADEIPMAAGFIDNVALPAFFANGIGSTSGHIYHYSYPGNEVNDWLIAATTERFGVPPDLFDPDGMNAALLITEALQATDGDASAEALIAAMEGIEFEGPKGMIYIRPEDHVAIQDMYISTLLNVDDPEFKYFEYVGTNRPNVPCLLPEELQDRCGNLPVGVLGSIEETTAPEPEAEEAAAVTCEEPVKIGIVTDETGPLAIYGAHILRAFPLGLEYLTGAEGTEGDGYTSYNLDSCELQVYVRDDQSNPENTATVGRELVEDIGVDIIVGTVSSGATATLQELARDNNVIHIAAPAAANDLTGATFNENSFRTSRNNYQDAVNICEYLTSQYSTFVQIAPDYSFGHGSAAAFRDACTLFGGEFVADDILAPADTTDFTPYMDQVLAAVDNGAETFIVTWAGGGFVPLQQAYVDSGAADEIPMAAGFIDNVVLPAFFGNGIGDTSGHIYHYSYPGNEINDWLIAATTDRFGTPPDLFDPDGMNAALLIGAALQATGGDASAEALIPAMEGIEFEGPKGMIYIRPEDHVAIQDMYISTLLNVDDPEFKYFEYVATNRPDVPCLLPENLQDRCGALPVGSLSGE